MAQGSTLYRFKISLSDVDRAVYETLDFRVAMHSSETEEFLLTRVLAYALNYGDGLEFSQGLCVPEEPAIRSLDPQGGVGLWIDIGNPAARRIHKAAKAARRVRIYTYKNPENLKREASGQDIHHASEIEIFAFDPAFLKALAAGLARDNVWSVIHNDGELMVTVGDETRSCQIGVHRLSE